MFAYGPADATAISKTHHLLPHLNPDWFYQVVLEKRPLNRYSGAGSGSGSNSKPYVVTTF